MRMKLDIISSTITWHLGLAGSHNFGEYTSFSPVTVYLPTPRRVVTHEVVGKWPNSTLVTHPPHGGQLELSDWSKPKATVNDLME